MAKIALSYGLFYCRKYFSVLQNALVNSDNRQCKPALNGVYTMAKIALSYGLFYCRKYFSVLQNALVKSDNRHSVNQP